MNKEYLYLSDKELLVIDEFGHATKRNVENDNMHDMLLLENDLEKINHKISKLEQKIQRDEELKNTTVEKIIIALIPFGILWLAYGISGLLAPKLYSYIIEAIFGITFATVAVDTGFILLTKDHKKHINGIKSELSTAYQLREEINQKLSKIKKESKDLTTTNIEDSQKTKTNDIVVLKDTTPFYEEIEKQLDESYTKGYKQKVKILTLNKKNKV